MKKKEKQSTNWLERVVTIISTILVLFTFAYLIYHWISDEQTVPNIEVSLGEVKQVDTGYSVAVTAENHGSQTAKNIVIEIVSQEDEKGQISFQYIPGKSKLRGWVTFTKKPNISNLKAQVLGYAAP